MLTSIGSLSPEDVLLIITGVSALGYLVVALCWELRATYTPGDKCRP